MAARKKRVSARRYILPVGLFICGLFFVGISSAKMISAPISRDSEVGVAAWSVNVTSSNSDNMTLDAGSDAKTYSLVVTNNSEIASAYGIKISDIPDGVKIGLDIDSESDLIAPTNGELVFTNTGGDLSYAAPNNTRTHILTLAADAEADITQSGIDMTIEVFFSQTEPRQ